MHKQMILLIFLFSCSGSNNSHLNEVTNDQTLSQENLVSGCGVSRIDDSQVKISCPDGSEVIISDGQDGKDGEDGVSCEVQDEIGGASIKCGESLVFIKHGIDGKDGSACKVNEAQDGSGALLECSDGTSAFIKNGIQGESCKLEEEDNGITIVCGDDKKIVKHGEGCKVYEETNGATLVCSDKKVFIADGAAGEGCDIQETSEGALVKCGDKSVVVENGKDGLDAVVEVVDPCGQETTHGFEEVLLVLNSGKIIAYLENEAQSYLVELQREKTYTTSDGTGCKFQVEADGKITW